MSWQTKTSLWSWILNKPTLIILVYVKFYVYLSNESIITKCVFHTIQKKINNKYLPRKFQKSRKYKKIDQ